MVNVTEVRESGVEILDSEVDEMEEGVEAVHFRTDSPVEIQVGESAGHEVTVAVQHFVAASINQEADEVTQMMTGQEEINESSVFISNEDAEIGGGFIQIDEGEIEDALDQFEAENL